MHLQPTCTLFYKLYVLFINVHTGSDTDTTINFPDDPRDFIEITKHHFLKLICKLLGNGAGLVWDTNKYCESNNNVYYPIGFTQWKTVENALHSYTQVSICETTHCNDKANSIKMSLSLSFYSCLLGILFFSPPLVKHPTPEPPASPFQFFLLRPPYSPLLTQKCPQPQY